MECIIEEITREQVNSVGAPKEIVVDSYEWTMHGESGRTYTYHMSKERFLRENQKAYRVQMVEGEESYLVATIGYYDLVDYSIEDCIGDRLIDQLALKTGVDSQTIWNLILNQMNPLQERIKQEFSQTEEAMTSKKNQEILRTYEEKKRKFCMELGMDGVKYDRCYNVFGELMDASYLDKIHEQVVARQEFSANSKRKHKDAWRNFSGSATSFMGQASYTEEETEMLGRFYKTLAKKFHPDANPGVDTSKEMQLLNQLKKHWGI